MLKGIFEDVPDFRRGQGQRYKKEELLLIIILAILSGATSYRKIRTYMESKVKVLKKELGIEWKKAPHDTTIRYFIHGLNKNDLENAFRKYSKKIDESEKNKYLFLSIDGKELRGSIDRLEDKRATQLLSVFNQNSKIILAHEEIKDKDKTNEIPKVQKLLKDLDINPAIITVDAMHCQKKHLKSLKKKATS